MTHLLRRQGLLLYKSKILYIFIVTLSTLKVFSCLHYWADRIHTPSCAHRDILLPITSDMIVVLLLFNDVLVKPTDQTIRYITW